MQLLSIVMDNSTKRLPVSRSEQYRDPLPLEQDIGLWVDRIGFQVQRASNSPRKMRLLGLYGAVYVETGQGVFISRSMGRQEVRPGHVMVLFPDEPHVYFPSPQWSTRWIVWSGPEAGILEENSYLTPDNALIMDAHGRTAAAYTTLSSLIHKENRGAVLQRKLIVTELIWQLYRILETDPGTRCREKEMEQMVREIQKEFTRDTSIAEIAARFHLSPTHFRRRFREFTGLSPRRFIMRLRISKARELLAQGDSIKQAAAACGYEDVFYFMRVFKQITGISPGRFAAGLK